MKKYNSARAEKSMGLILGLGSSGSRLIKNHKVKYLDTAEFENIRIEGADSYVVGHDASDFDRVSLRRLLDSISRVLLVTFGGGKAGGEMTSFAALHALSKKMPVHVVLSYPQLWEGSRRARNAIALHVVPQPLGDREHPLAHRQAGEDVVAQVRRCLGHAPGVA